MWFIILAAIVAVWAVWVAWEVNRAGGYPPYQDSCTQDCCQGRNCDCYERSCDMAVSEYDANWPFPRSKP